MRTHSIVCLAIILIFFYLPSASGMDLMVKPMRVEIYARPGEKVEQLLEVRNTSSTKITDVALKSFLLKQSDNGFWVAADPEKSEANLNSCLEWMRFSTKNLQVDPLQTGKIALRMTVPRRARGTYTAVLTIASQPKPEPGKIGIAIRFMVPVLVHIKSPAARKKIDFPEIGMAYLEKAKNKKAATKVWFKVANTGQAAAQVRGKLDIMTAFDGRWKRVASAAVGERMVIPGAAFDFTQTVEKDLPSGKYKLRAKLYVDGRPHRPLEREIDFVGDPNVKELVMDVPIRINPQVLDIEAMPGSRRARTISIENGGVDPVVIQCEVEQPAGLKSVMMGDVKGDDFSCHTWATVSPKKFSLRGGRKRNLRIMVNPAKEGGGNQPFHYAGLKIRAFHQSGQDAGSARAEIVVKNKKIPPLYRVQEMGITLNRAKKENLYNFSLRLGNTGNAHLDLKCGGSVTNAAGMKNLANFNLTREPGMVLPLGTPRFDGTIDFSSIAPGTYLIKVNASHEEHNWPQTLPVKVTAGKKGKTVEIIELKEG